MTIRAIKIDPIAKTIDWVDLPTDEEGDVSLEALYREVNCRMITAVHPFGFESEDRDLQKNFIYLDDEGLYNEGPQAFFEVEGYPHPLVNTGLVFSLNDEGNSEETTFSLDQVKEAVNWVAPIAMQNDDGERVIHWIRL